MGGEEGCIEGGERWKAVRKRNVVQCHKENYNMDIIFKLIFKIFCKELPEQSILIINLE